MIDGLFGFPQLHQRARVYEGSKVAFMVQCFKTLHADAPEYDFECKLGDRIAGIIKQAGGDYLRVLQLMWIASAQGIQGSHLDYIQKMLSRQQSAHRVNTADPDKFKSQSSGKYAGVLELHKQKAAEKAK